MTRKTRIATFCLAVAISATGLIALAGDLNPPTGPVAPTQRTPVNANMTPGDADSIFKITLPGSYYLTGNITGVAAKHGIEIAASGVTLDLNGFDLLGVPGMGLFDGVSTTVSSLTNIAVVNGSVRNWGDEGVDLGSISAASCRVEGVCASGNTGNGISAGTGGTVFNCSAFSNTGIGIVSSLSCTLTNCAAYLNTGNGINTGNGCTVTNCSAFDNSGNGISTGFGCTVSNCSADFSSGSGISTGGSCTVADCNTRSNTLDGILCTSACVIRGNTCASNGNGGVGAGIHATSNDNRIEGNNCTGADTGIDVDSVGNLIIRNTCASNVTDWDIAANNVYGPIIDRRAPASAAVLGFTAASSLGSVEPNANFSY